MEEDSQGVLEILNLGPHLLEELKFKSSANLNMRKAYSLGKACS